MDFNTEYDGAKTSVEKNLLKYIEHIKSSPQATLYESMKYSLEAGGKRFRPVLFLKTIELFGGNIEVYMDVACSLEYIHTYSLIHDDLPSMDNDEYRRGKKTNHIVFGEDLAILAGDGLLNTAMEMLFDKIVEHPSKETALGAQIIAKGAGITGMIAGQIVDIQSEGKKVPKETLDYIHENKTGALIEASVLAAALMMGGSEIQISALKEYAKNLGLAFQISDDILDVSGDFNALGKKTGSDEKNDKTTYASYYGLEKATQLLEEYVVKAVGALNVFDSEDRSFLAALAKYVAARNS